MLIFIGIIYDRNLKYTEENKVKLWWHIHYHRVVKTIGRWEYKQCRCGHKSIDIKSSFMSPPLSRGETRDNEWLYEDREPMVRCWHCDGKGSIWGYASATAPVKSHKKCSRCAGSGVL